MVDSKENYEWDLGSKKAKGGKQPSTSISVGRLTIVIASIADLVLRAELYSILMASVHGDAQKKV